MLMARHQNDMKVANESFRNMAKLKYLGMTVTNQKLYARRK